MSIRKLNDSFNVISDNLVKLRKAKHLSQADVANDLNLLGINIHKNDITRILKFIAVFVELLGYLIFMEIIHLNFCGLSRNVAKNIQERAKIEYSIDNFSESDYNINDFDNDESNKS